MVTALPRTTEATVMRATNGPDSSPSPRPRYTPGAVARRFKRSVTRETVVNAREPAVSAVGPFRPGHAAATPYGYRDPSRRAAPTRGHRVDAEARGDSKHSVRGKPASIHPGRKAMTDP